MVATMAAPMGQLPHSTAAVITRGQKTMEAQIELHHGHQTILDKKEPVPNLRSMDARMPMVMSSK